MHVEPVQYQTEHLRMHLRIIPFHCCAHFFARIPLRVERFSSENQELLVSYLVLAFRHIDRMQHPFINGQHLVFTAPPLVFFSALRQKERSTFCFFSTDAYVVPNKC